MEKLTFSDGKIITELGIKNILTVIPPTESEIDGKKYWFFNIEYAKTKNSTSNINIIGTRGDVYSDHEKLMKFMDEVKEGDK